MKKKLVVVLIIIIFLGGVYFMLQPNQPQDSTSVNNNTDVATNQTVYTYGFLDNNLEFTMKFINEEIEVDFYLQDVVNENNKSILSWYNDSFGSIHLEFLNNHEVENEERIPYNLKLSPSSNCSGLIMFSIDFAAEKEPYFMIPAVLYGTNNKELSTSFQPKFVYKGALNYPQTPFLYTRADRSTHNSSIAVFDNMTIGFRIDEGIKASDTHYYNGVGIESDANKVTDRLAVTVGYKHDPVMYKGKISGVKYPVDGEPVYGYLDFKSGIDYETKGHIYLGQSSNNYGYENAVRWFYEEIHEHPGNDIDRNGAIKAIANAIITDGYNSEGNYFPLIVAGKEFSEDVPAGDTSWTGGMQVAYPLIRASEYVPEAKDVAVTYINDLVTTGINPDSGFFYDSKNDNGWSVSGWWKNDMLALDKRIAQEGDAHASYVNGQATTYLLKSYNYAMSHGWDDSEIDIWLTTCQQIVDRVIEMQREDGAIGAFYSHNTGEALYYESMQGAWFMAAIAELAKITGEDKYFASFERANEFYYKYIEAIELWGMPMDVRGAVDEEGNLAYVTALTTMHKLTGDEKILEQLVHALNYEFTWKFPYNTYHVNEPLKSLEWSSSGGSVTSTHNVHIHQMGNLIAEEMYYVYQQTGDDYILNRLKDTLNWGLGTFNYGEQYFGFGEEGWATEQFFHTDSVQDNAARINDGGVWPDFLPWASSCILLSTASDIPDEYYLGSE